MNMETKELLSVALIILAVLFFFQGFHHIDNAWNMDSACWDTALDGITSYSKPELYRMGWTQTFIALALFIVSILISFIRVK